MALGPDLARLHAFQQELLAGAARCPTTRSSRSPSCRSTRRPRTTSGRASRDEDGITDAAELEARLGRVARTDRALPREPHPPAAARRRRRCASTRCRSAATRRRQLVRAAVRGPQASSWPATRASGGRYAGRVLQLITGSIGLDDWEWGVTLLADDPVALKEIVNEMRFDEVSARYAEFGPFFTGLLLDPADVLERVGCDERRRARLLRVVPGGARGPADDLRDRQGVRRRAEHPARGQSRPTRAGSSSSSPARPTTRRGDRRTSRESAAR